MKFSERMNAKTGVDLISTQVPQVMINPIAISKMWTYVDECSDEIGWLGTAIKDGNDYYIQDVYLFDQDVHSTTTEITPEGLTKFAEAMLEQSDGIEIWNNLKVWGHSHVSMSVSPSSQDDHQMETFADCGHEWFIRIIANKKGDLVIDLYDFKASVAFIDLPWEITRSIEEETIESQIAQLYTQIDQIRSKNLKIEKKWIVDEMKVKVKKKKDTYWSWSKDKKGNKEDILRDESEVYTYFSDEELSLLGTCPDIKDMENDLRKAGFFQFSTNDMQKIFNVAYKELQNGFYQGGY